MFMQLVQMPECGGFDLTWADRLRKSIAKKNPAAYEELQKEYFQQVEEKHLSKTLCNYVWNVLVATSRGYGFNKSHTLAYSLIALQEMNLAFKYPIMFWNCACLIVDSGGIETINEDCESDIEDGIFTEEYENYIKEFRDDEDDYEDDEEEDEKKVTNKKKKKPRSPNYGKIASTIGKIKATGVKVAPPDINKSTFTFSPDIENNTIRYGLSGITRVGGDLIKDIIQNRPYENFVQFLQKIKVTKPQMVNLIKSGAFDEFGDRFSIMENYIESISDKKQQINLRNLQMLINFNLIPEDYEFQVKIFNYNKYLKKLKYDIYFALDNIAFNFFEHNFDVDLLIQSDLSESGFMIKQDDWNKIYKKQQNIIRPYVKENEQSLKDSVNTKLFNDMWFKYCQGNISKWEMDAVSFYRHKHELENVNYGNRKISDFEELPDNPVITQVITIKGKMIPLFEIERIAGTILDKDKAKKTITLLTTSGVVNVRIFGDVFTHYDRQISVKGADGKKHVKEKSWFARGNKVIISGIKREDSFTAKKYSKTPWHLVELITKVNDDGTIETVEERMEVE